MHEAYYPVPRAKWPTSECVGASNTTSADKYCGETHLRHFEANIYRGPFSRD